MPFFQHQQIDFHYELSGSGPPVVFCHGLTGDLTQIQELLGNLPGYSQVLWDVRGHGLTAPLGPAEAFTFKQFAADLHALLVHLGINRAVVGGVSMGAAVTARFAIDWPELVSSVVLVRPAWLNRPSPEPLAMFPQIGDLLAQFGAAEGRRRFENSAEYRQLKAVDSEAAQACCEQFDRPQAEERCVRLQRIPADCPIRDWDEVSRLSMPALVIGCESDYVHPYAYADEWSRRLPRATLHNVPPKAGDMAQHNQAVQAAVLSYLRRCL